MKIICMGDSLTYGTGLEDRENQCWSALAAKRTGYEMVNRGVGGDTTAGMLARCQNEVFACRPDAMILLGGANDIFYTWDYRPASANVISMVKQAQSHGISVLVGLPLPFVAEEIPVRAWNADRDNHHVAAVLARYARWLTLYCTESKIPVIDFRSHFFNSDGSVRRELFFSDGVHPNPAGHQLLADILCEALQTYFHFISL